MVRTIYWYFYLIFGFFLISLHLPALKKMKETKTEDEQLEYAYKKASDYCEKLLKKTGAKIQVSGLENVPKDGAVLFIGNHQSNFDIIILLAILKSPVAFVSKKQIGYAPLLGTWMHAIGCLFMDREDIRQSAKCINEGIEKLKRGRRIVIFPEGTRSRNGEIGEFKAGSFKLSTKSGAVIVPITFCNSRDIMEANGNKIRAASASVTFHAPVDPKNFDAEQLKSLNNIVRDIVISK